MLCQTVNQITAATNYHEKFVITYGLLFPNGVEDDDTPVTDVWLLQ